jgi:hypothetical protein
MQVTGFTEIHEYRFGTLFSFLRTDSVVNWKLAVDSSRDTDDVLITSQTDEIVLKVAYDVAYVEMYGLVLKPHFDFFRVSSITLDFPPFVMGRCLVRT